MDEELMICHVDANVSVEDTIQHLHIEQDPNDVLLGEMEDAYRYELWRCLDLLQKSLETITQQEVKTMWGV